MFHLFAVRIFDRWACNQTCFNAARSCKPFCTRYKEDLKRTTSVCDMPVADCDFCQPYKFTAIGIHYMFQ